MQQKVSQKAAQRYEELSKALKEAEKARKHAEIWKGWYKRVSAASKEVESLQKAVEKRIGVPEV